MIVSHTDWECQNISMIEHNQIREKVLQAQNQDDDHSTKL